MQVIEAQRASILSLTITCINQSDEYIQVGSQKAARRRGFAEEECRPGGSR